MPAHGAAGEGEALGDGGVAEALGDEAQHLRLARGQADGRTGRGGRHGCGQAGGEGNGAGERRAGLQGFEEGACLA